MRMRPVRATPLSLALALAALLLLCVAVPHTASAHSSLGCETVWEAPSKDNDILLCMTDVNRIKSQWRHYVFPALAVLLFVLVLVIFPLFFLCTLCASTCGTPPTEDEGKGSRCCLWMWIIYTLMWGFGVALFVIVGAKTMADAAVGTMNNTEIPLNFARGVKHMVEDLVQNQTVGDSQFSVPKLDLSAFDNVEELVNESMKQPRELLDKYVKYVPMVSYGVGALPIVLMSLVALVAFCRCCVPCLPLVLSWVYWAFGVVFSLLAIVMVVLAYVFSTLCGEIAAHNERDPGLLQWYLVPFCESTVNFGSIRNRINTAEKDVAGIACENLLKYCDRNNTGVGDLVSNVLSKFVGNPDEVKKLLAKLPPGTLPSGVDPSAIAQGGPLPEAVSELLSNGADVNTLATLASGGLHLVFLVDFPADSR
ncbi:hypothetical protein ERJ75_000429900 [Trypanosoma vivax]|nr:hypothetical protein ERJ75_000429900 [Trypanosoma vivax]